MIENIFYGEVIKSGYSANEILSRCRRSDLVAARRKIALALRENGFSYPQIGKVMNRDHSSIIHLCKPLCLAKWLSENATK